MLSSVFSTVLNFQRDKRESQHTVFKFKGSERQTAEKYLIHIKMTYIKKALRLTVSFVVENNYSQLFLLQLSNSNSFTCINVNLYNNPMR